MPLRHMQWNLLEVFGHNSCRCDLVVWRHGELYALLYTQCIIMIRMLSIFVCRYNKPRWCFYLIVVFLNQISNIQQNSSIICFQSYVSCIKSCVWGYTKYQPARFKKKKYQPAEAGLLGPLKEGRDHLECEAKLCDCIKGSHTITTTQLFPHNYKKSSRTNRTQ